MTDQQQALADAHRAGVVDRDAVILDQSSNRLGQIVRRKFRTTFVHPLAEFEKVFGLELWGHGLPEESLTARQLANRKRWEQVRIDILNVGNTQARAVLAELALHSIRFVGYRTAMRGGQL